jgi:PST family polysaccharide transporter
LVVQILVTAVVSTTLFWSFCPWRPDMIPQWRRAGSALRFGLPLAGFSLMNYCHRQLDNVLIGWRWGAADLGYYTRAYTLLTLPLALVSVPMAQAVIPALSRLQDDPERWRAAFLKVFAALNLVSAGLTATIIASAEPLVRLVYGPGWDESGHIFLFLAISMFASTPATATSWIYVSLGQTPRMLKWSLIVTPFYVLAFFVGLPFGAKGVALCYSIAVCLAALPALAYATKNSPVSLRQVLPTFVSVEVLLRWAPGSHSALVRVIEASALTGALYLAGAVPLLLFSKSLNPLRDQLGEWLHKIVVR